jgi:hypothetical protein
VAVIAIGHAHAAQERRYRFRDAGACYSIPDADTRAVCLALARRDPGMCYAVEDYVRRTQCLADARR